MFKTPILLLIYNRPDLTEKVSQQIQKIDPKYLYIASDGPKNSKDKKIVNKTRGIVLNNIKSQCETRTLFRKENWGCKRAVSLAINWFFQNVEKGIILEDDILPNKAFFYFCENLLNKFENDQRVMHISGFSHTPYPNYDYSYYYSKYTPVWGWATWKRSWKYYDIQMLKLKKFLKENRAYDIYSTPQQAKNRIRILKSVRNNKIDTWDYQWNFSCICENALSIIPKIPLTQNIGFSQNATHTKKTPKHLDRNLPKNLHFPLKHPILKIVDKSKDQKHFKVTHKKSILKKIRKII